VYVLRVKRRCDVTHRLLFTAVAPHNGDTVCLKRPTARFGSSDKRRLPHGMYKTGCGRRAADRST
jgi:hypothetical protein